MTTRLPTLEAFLRRQPDAIQRGPLAIMLIEDAAAIEDSLRHHLRLGFRHILALSPEPVALANEFAGRVSNLRWDTRQPGAHIGAVNAVIAAVPQGTWLYYCFNAEFLFFPFSESRLVSEMLAFHSEERRDAMLAYVVDLYASDLGRHPDAVSLADAMFDRTGYYALARPGPDGKALPRQLDFHGGLRWRFEEHLPADRRRIDRIALFRARKDLRIDDGHLFNIAEYNTYSCAWHHNITCAVASFRIAKALMRNAGSRDQINGFTWRNSHPFQWRSQQLMDLGLMEPGQWF